MKSFLEEQVELIFDQHKAEIDEISIIIPNRRAATYIQKYLANQYRTPFFAPEILTINEWINEHTAERILSNTELLFVLHSIHKEIESEPESFESFIQWGKTLLTDFDEIDKYMISPSSIFKNLRDIKEIENWSFDTEELSTAQIKFKTLWDKLEEYYTKLEIRLSEMNATYSGKAYYRFYLNLQSLDLKKHYYFLGFNAVSRVERQIMHALIQEKKATVKFDVDTFYLDNEQHEAGHFYREIIKEWDIKPQPDKHFNEIKKRIEIIETSQQVAQAKIAGNLVRKLNEEGKDLSKTAIVLADESLLIPLSRSLPPEIEQVNITMGWPIKFSHLKGFMDLVFDLQFNFQKFKHDRIYHKSIASLLQHPYIIEIIGSTETKQAILDKMHEQNKIFMDLQELIEEEGSISELSGLLKPWRNANPNRLKSIHELIALLYKQIQRE
jgi:ATP-dependent helicase/nuclease subunit B